MTTIYTHMSVDIDAVASVWAARQFVPGFREAKVEFRPVNWDGTGAAEGSLLLDMSAGTKGVKDPDGTVHSCFKSLVLAYAPAEARQVLAKLVAFIDAQDAYGSAVRHLAPGIGEEAGEVLAATGLNAVLRAFQWTCRNDDAAVVAKMSEIFSGMFEAGLSRQRAQMEADQARVFGQGRVAIVENSKEYATNGVLFEQGVEVVVYVDGNNLGVVRRNDVVLRMDHPDIRRVVAEGGEEGEWFAHPAGFLYCRGSRKAPAESPSQVAPAALAEAAAAALTGSRAYSELPYDEQVRANLYEKLRNQAADQLKGAHAPTE